MEFTNEFFVPSDIETTFATLTDLERVAPCLPGATLEEVDGDTYTGRCKVKVGPVQVTYRGTARLAEVDHDNKTGHIEASGKETRGTGTASADVRASLVEKDEGTTVTVVTDLNVTGKPAQFGRGVMAEVGTRIIDTFADRLREMLEADDQLKTDAAASATTSGDAAASDAADDAPAATPQRAAGDTTEAPAAPSGPRQIEPQPGREDDALDMLDMAGAATLKRIAPLVAVAAAIAGLIWWLRNR